MLLSSRRNLGKNNTFCSNVLNKSVRNQFNRIPRCIPDKEKSDYYISEVRRLVLTRRCNLNIVLYLCSCQNQFSREALDQKIAVNKKTKTVSTFYFVDARNAFRTLELARPSRS